MTLSPPTPGQGTPSPHPSCSSRCTGSRSLGSDSGHIRVEAGVHGRQPRPCRCKRGGPGPAQPPGPPPVPVPCCVPPPGTRGCRWHRSHPHSGSARSRGGRSGGQRCRAPQSSRAAPSPRLPVLPVTVTGARLGAGPELLLQVQEACGSTELAAPHIPAGPVSLGEPGPPSRLPVLALSPALNTTLPAPGQAAAARASFRTGTPEPCQPRPSPSRTRAGRTPLGLPVPTPFAHREAGPGSAPVPDRARCPQDRAGRTDRPRSAPGRGPPMTGEPGQAPPANIPLCRPRSRPGPLAGRPQPQTGVGDTGSRRRAAPARLPRSPAVPAGGAAAPGDGGDRVRLRRGTGPPAARPHPAVTSPSYSQWRLGAPAAPPRPASDSQSAWPSHGASRLEARGLPPRLFPDGTASRRRASLGRGGAGDRGGSACREQPCGKPS